MSVPKKIFRGAIGVGVGTLALLSSSGVAAADTTDVQSVTHTFTTAAGQSVTCTVRGESTIFGSPGDPRRRAQSIASAFGSSPACSPGFASVQVSYTDTRAVTEHASASAYTDSVTWTGDDVTGGTTHFAARHLYRFADCRANCSVELATAPK